MPNALTMALALAMAVSDGPPAEQPRADADDRHVASCRFCATPLGAPFLDLGMSPLANSSLRADQLGRMEPFYPLRVHRCDSCSLVQLEEFQTAENIFGDYAYFSSYSDSWLEHARRYVEMACDRFPLGPCSRVVEVASNDGYLLQYMLARQIPVLGIEPARNIAAVAQAAGIPTRCEFFGVESARSLVSGGCQADLLVGNNVLAHVPDLNDFVAGLRILLAPEGAITMEFPHLLQLMERTQFDTIYHEHFSYFSLLAAERIFAHHGLRIWDVEELATHGGSLRIFAQHAGSGPYQATGRVEALTRREAAAGLDGPERYGEFAAQVQHARNRLVEFCIAARRAGKRIAGYGAPAKGNTLLNYCGLRTDSIDYTVDRSPHKQGTFLPGTHIPVFHPDHIRETRPDYVLILPWNLEEEVVSQMGYIREWGGRFVIPIPEVAIR